MRHPKQGLSIYPHLSGRDRAFGRLRARARLFASADCGMSTAEYAIGTIAAAAFAAVLYAVLTNDSIADGLAGLVEQALSVQF